MAFKKGQSGNAKGRPKNRPNKITAITKSAIAEILTGQSDAFITRWKQLPPKEFCDVYLSLLPYVTPKETKQETEVKINSFEELMKTLPYEPTDEPTDETEPNTPYLSLIK